MKQNKQSYKKPPGHTIPNSSTWWLNAIVFLPLTLVVLVCIFFFFVSLIDERQVGFTVGMELVLVPVAVIFGGFAIQSIRARGDYLRFSREGIEMRLHPEFKFWKSPTIGFFDWTQIEQCGVREQRVRYGTKYFFLLKLVGEEEVCQYSLGHLQDGGSGVKEELRHYAKVRLSRALEEEETERAKDTVGDYIVCGIFIAGLFVSSNSFSLFDHTFIVSWFWVVVVCSCLLVAIPLRGISKLKKGTHYLLAASVGMLLCCALLKVNYQFADWSSKPVIRNYRVVESGYHTDKYEKSKPFIIIDLGLEYKEIGLTSEMASRLLGAETIDFEVHPGALGFEVW